MAITRKNISWLLPLLALAAALTTIYIVYYVLGFNWQTAATDGAITGLLLGGGVWSLRLITCAYPTRVGIMLYALFIATFVSLAVSYINGLTLSWLLTDEKKYVAWLEDTRAVRFIFIWLVHAWAGTLTALYKKTEALENMYQSQSNAEVLLRDAELFKLRQQLQPHFLYNSLNSISTLILIQPDRAQEMIGRLSDFLRSSVKREAQENISIADELAYIQAYLDIESIRFGHRLEINIEQHDTDGAQLPPFLLQPLLENAIKFGLYGHTGNVAISIDLRLQHGLLVITIINPYDAQASQPKGTGFGLQSISRRLYLLYARTDLITTAQDGQLFTTVLKIPQPHV